MTPAALRAAIARLRHPDHVDQLVHGPAPTNGYGWARDGVWLDTASQWPGSNWDAVLVTTWTATCPCCDVGTTAVAAVVIADPPDTHPMSYEEDEPVDVEVHAWLCDDGRVLHHTVTGWCVTAPSPGMHAIRRLQHDLAARWQPAELIADTDSDSGH